ncbi:MAG TPA: RNA polymerase sigma factor [Actinomycetota bacterium]|nr:RNA polymerase sigma factor [Actinomycetota bacterium]
MDAEFDHLLKKARAGNSEAWEQIYRSLAPIVLGYFRGRNARDPEDLVGDVFLNVVRSLSGFEGDERDFRSWVLTIAHHRLVDHWRNRSRRPVETPLDSADALSLGDIELEVLDRLEAELVQELIGTLSSDQQTVILLRLIGDLSVDEVAKIVGKRPGAVRALQHRGLASLRRKITWDQPVTLTPPAAMTPSR